MNDHVRGTRSPPTQIQWSRFRDIMLAVASDQGGITELTEARLQLVRRFAALSQRR
jgi:hypothetical protein